MIRCVIAIGVGVVLLSDSALADRCDQVKQAVATYGYAAARKHALENYGKEAVAFGDKCLRGSAPLEAAEPKLETGRANLRPESFPRPALLAQSRPPDNQIVTVGPWTIATTYKADKFDNCTMSRSTDELGISVVWTKEGQLLFVNSPKWKLDRGKAYGVRLVAGSRSVEAEALPANARQIMYAARPHIQQALMRVGAALYIDCHSKA